MIIKYHIFSVTHFQLHTVITSINIFVSIFFENDLYLDFKLYLKITFTYNHFKIRDILMLFLMLIQHFSIFMDI